VRCYELFTSTVFTEVVCATSEHFRKTVNLIFTRRSSKSLISPGFLRVTDPTGNFASGWHAYIRHEALSKSLSVAWIAGAIPTINFLNFIFNFLPTPDRNHFFASSIYFIPNQIHGLCSSPREVRETRRKPQPVAKGPMLHGTEPAAMKSRPSRQEPPTLYLLVFPKKSRTYCWTSTEGW